MIQHIVLEVQPLRPLPESADWEQGPQDYLSIYRGLAQPTDCHRVSRLALVVPLRGMDHYSTVQMRRQAPRGK